jgi:hypothetical protein
LLECLVQREVAKPQGRGDHLLRRPAFLSAVLTLCYQVILHVQPVRMTKSADRSEE